MFLKNYLNENTKIKKIGKGEKQLFSGAYDFWSENLFERAVRLYTYANLPDSIPAHEPEVISQMNGSSGVTNKKDNKVRVYNGQYCGEPTEYFDIFKSYSVYAPGYSDILEVDKDVIVIRNNSLMNSIYPLVHRYAVLLAHTQVSYINVCITGRNNSIPISHSPAGDQSIRNYRNNLCNGSITPIMDLSFSDVEFINIPHTETLNARELIEIMRDLLCSFYNDIGVRTTRAKKGNMIQEEIMANDSMLLLNLNDGLEQRKIGWDKVNSLFNLNVTVDMAEEVKYLQEDDFDEYENNINKFGSAGRK